LEAGVSKKSSWIEKSARIVYKNPWLEVREYQVLRPDGKPGVYAVVEKHPTCFIIPLHQNGSVTLIREDRFPVKSKVWQLPGGAVETGEDLLKTAQQELEEEAGLGADGWQELGSFFLAPGHEATQIHVFLATGLHRETGNVQKHQAREGIGEVKIFSQKQLKDMIRRGEIRCGITLAALNLFFQASVS
jgi:8-oxo-dGTP pyrophosphatase MutT (NUDIX family)